MHDVFISSKFCEKIHRSSFSMRLINSINCSEKYPRLISAAIDGCKAIFALSCSFVFLSISLKVILTLCKPVSVPLTSALMTCSAIFNFLIVLVLPEENSGRVISFFRYICLIEFIQLLLNVSP